MTQSIPADFQDDLSDQKNIHEKVAVISDNPTYISNLATNTIPLPLSYTAIEENQPDSIVAQSFESALDDEQVSAVHLYLETVREVSTLSHAALKAVRKGVPVVILRGGRSAPGKRAAQQPSLNGISDEGILNALFERLGFIQCTSLEETVETLKMLIYGGRPLGNKLAISTGSVASSVLASDMATSAGLNVPTLEESVSTFITPLNRNEAVPGNPLHLAEEVESQSKIYRSFLAGSFDVAVQIKEPSDDWSQVSDLFFKEAKNQSMPSVFINTSNEQIPSAIFDTLIANGAAPLNGMHFGFKAITNAVNFVDHMVLMAQMPTGAIVLPTVDNLIQTVQVDEVEGKRLLYGAGVSVPKAAVIEGSSAIGLNELSFPVVLKAVAADLTHKTELGAVKLSINSDEALRQTLFDMNDWLDSVDLRGFLIEEMVTDGIGELLVGVRHVAEVGQVLTLAFGGVTVELLGDAKTIILPASSSEIEQALRSLRLFPTINGWRGKPAADIDQVVESISLICNYALSQRDRLFALEINPLIVRPAPHNPVAADAVFQFGEKAKE